MNHDWPAVVTPRDIAAKLELNGQRPDKTLRQFLRDRPPIPHVPYERWLFTPEQADAIVQAWCNR